MSRIYIVILIIFSFPATLSAQKIKIIDVSHRGWSGGVAGRHGDNYVFTVECSGFKKEPVPDTMWIGKDPVRIITATEDKLESVNTKITRTKNAVKFEIRCNLKHDDYADNYPVQGTEQEKKYKPVAPVKYRGVALMSYIAGNKKQYFAIPKVLTNYPQQNYP